MSGEAGARGRSTLITLALAAGAVTGTALNAAFGRSQGIELSIRYLFDPIGQIWLRALIMVVVPLILASLALGVVGLSGKVAIARVGGLTFVYFVALSAIAVVIGLTLAQTIRPGDGLPESVKQSLLATYGAQAKAAAETASRIDFGVATLVNVVPRNPLRAMVDGDMLAVIFFALVLGASTLALGAEKRKPLLDLLEAVNEAMIVVIGFVMRLAPIGVFCLVFSVTARFGFDILVSLGLYVVTVVIGLCLHLFGVMSLCVRWLLGVSPREFFARTKLVMLTAFSTSSSNATLPTTLDVCRRELGLPSEVSGFVIPLGATMNMNGTALFEGTTVLFLAQVFGIELDWTTQIVVMVMAVVTAIGAAGVPGGSIPLLIMVLGVVGVPAEGIAIVIGVDRILDMCRTVVNVTGDVTACGFVARRTAGWRLPARAELAAEAG